MIVAFHGQCVAVHYPLVGDLIWIPLNERHCFGYNDLINVPLNIQITKLFIKVRH